VIITSANAEFGYLQAATYSAQIWSIKYEHAEVKTMKTTKTNFY